MFNEIRDIRIRKLPLLSGWFDFGTIVFVTYTETGRKKVLARFLGIKFPEEVYLELIKKISVDDAKENVKDVLL